MRKEKFIAEVLLCTLGVITGILICRYLLYPFLPKKMSRLRYKIGKFIVVSVHKILIKLRLIS